MIQRGSFLKVADNSGAKFVKCLKIYGINKKTAKIGDLILVSVKSIREQRKLNLRIKKGEMCKALIIRTKSSFILSSSCSFSCSDNYVILLNKQFKFLGTRVFGSIPKIFRFTRFLRLLTISGGTI